MQKAVRNTPAPTTHQLYFFHGVFTPCLVFRNVSGALGTVLGAERKH